MQGLMFLPDGRVLIMDNELYQKTIEQSIVLDMFESGNQIFSDSLQNSIEEEKQENSSFAQYRNLKQLDMERKDEPYSFGVSSTIAGRISKENTRKQSQAN